MGSFSFGKYRLIAELGHGGMADVFLAVAAGPVGSGFRKLTVLKRLRQNLAEEKEFVTMFVDEARIAARLNHANVVQTNEVGSVGNTHFIAMEYLDGQPLHRLQSRSSQNVQSGVGAVLTPEHEYLVLMDALAGLHHAHEFVDFDGKPLEIVHRDATPQNIFVTYDGQVKVVDFGIAKAANRSTETREGVVKGKVRYMAPEQAMGLPVTRRVDIFSVGVMLWEAALRRRMWQEKDDNDIFRALITGDMPPSPCAVDPGVPGEIDRICRKALAIRAEDRYATAEELRNDLEQHLASTGALLQARRQLAPTVSSLFEDRRTEMRRIIEAQLASIDEEPSAPSVEMTGIPDLRSSPNISRAKHLADMGLDAATQATISISTASTTRSRLAKQQSTRTFTIAAALAVALAGGLGVWRLSSSAKASRPAAGGPTATATTSAVITVAVRLSASAPGARVSIDDKPWQPLPLDLRVPADSLAHQVRVEADGYEPLAETVTFNADVGRTFALQRKAERPATSADPKPKGPSAALPVQPWRPVTSKPSDPKATEPKPDAPPTTAPSGPATAPPTTDPGRSRLNVDSTNPYSTQ